MRAVEKNSFFKSTTINKAIAVKPNFPDLAWGGTEETMTIKSGADPTYYMLSGALPTTPKYGESEMVGGFLTVYVSGVSMPSTPQLPQFELYRTKPGVEIDEGTMRPSYRSGNIALPQVGQDMVVYRSAVTDDNYVMKEDFDGSDKTLGEIKMITSLGNGTAELGDAYLEFNVAKNKAKSLGNIFSQRQGFALRQYFTGGGIPGVGIYPENGDTRGVWRPTIDQRKGNKKAIWSLPWWKYKNIKGHIKFNQKTAVSSDLDSAPLATKGNTLFDDVYKTQDMNNPFTSDVNNPLVMTSCELSTAKKYSGGQAFRMYHLWDFSNESQAVQKALGINQLIPTMTRASIFDIPRPHWGLDAAQPDSGAGAAHLGWQSSFAPCMEMRMNISKLQYNPYLAYWDYTGSDIGFTSCDLYYPDNSLSPSNATIDNKKLTGLYRCVAITWSNYKPKTDHITLDRFLDYGLQRFYAGSGSEHIVGGLVFQRTGIDISATADADSGNMFVSALPVTKYRTLDVDSDSQLLLSGGLAKMQLIGHGDADNTVAVATDFWANSPEDSVQMVNVPLDSWFNMKVYYDGFAQNSGGDSGGSYRMSAQDDLYSGGGVNLQDAGTPMRAYFELPVVEAGQDEEVNELENNPYVDIYFPCTSGASSGSASAPSTYCFNNDRATYPMHMTVWVQNYRWIDGTTGSDPPTLANTYNNSYGIFNWGDAEGAFPSGAAIEAEVYIDDISFYNFSPEVINCSAGSSITSQRNVTFSQEGQVSPFTTMTTGTGDANRYMTRAWAVSGQSTSGNMERITGQENVLFGFDNTTMLPGTTADPVDDYTKDAWGYILANGFSTVQFDNLDRVLPTAFLSVSGSEINQNRLGGNFFGSHWLKTATENTALWTGSTLSGSYITSTNDAAVNTLGGAATGNLNMMTSDTTAIPSQDGFTAKGLMRFAVSGAGFDGDGTWTKRENIMAATKIVAVPGLPGRYGGPDVTLSTNQIMVKNTNIFNKYIDEEYIIFAIGRTMPSATSGSAYTKGWGTSSLKLADDAPIDDTTNVVSFNDGIVTADDGSSALCFPTYLMDLWISPKKYWLNMLWYADKTQRTYKNFLVVQNVDTGGTSNIEPTAAAMQGATWNESTYSYDSDLRTSIGQSGLYLRPWNLEPSTDDSTLITNIDYGYGPWNEEKQEGGEISQATAFIDKWVEMDMTALAKSRDSSPEENIVFRIGTADNTGTQSITIYTDEFTTDVGKRPTMFWEYKDTLPKITTPLIVESNFNVLSGSGTDKVDLYKLDREELNAVKFKWEEEGDDILYRLLYIDTNPIDSKYDGIRFQAPLNELPASNRAATGNYYTGSARIAAASLAPATLRSITGSSGWAYDGNYASSTTGIDWPQTAAAVAWSWFDTTEATFIGHCVPNHTGTQTQGTIMTDMDATYGSFKMYYTKAGSANADVTPVFELVSGAAGYSGKTYTLTSAYSFPNDGESPLFVVVTFNASLPNNNLKMYVNGMLVKQSAGNWVTDRAIYDGTGYTGKMNLGNEADTGGTKKLRGTLQECIIHSKELHVPISPNEYILPTQYLPDMSSGTEIKYNARLFLFDYHNIIGSSSDTVCSSNQISWEATGI